MEIVKREFIYHDETDLEPGAFKTYINKYIKELRARKDVYKVSGTVTEDFSTIRYTQILPDPEPSDEKVEDQVEIESAMSEEVQNQLG